eukprot:TRINITY_DN781957_c0_g1_i1.p1 TRINITY_DN781957_c0_g1~~TRINITY_DN781957_c0_g1_i1.p1  ORF type:complete len:248 (-),score=61.42 TRINITY_DN781957_c0_g1_i1:107-850(-)
MSEWEEQIVLPGKDVTEIIVGVTSKPKIGEGLKKAGPDSIVVTKAGLLKHKSPNKFFVEATQKRYIPKKGDDIIGVVIDKNVERYQLEIHGSAVASLGVVEFEGATNRNRPQLQIGDTVFCRVVEADKDLDVEVSCKAAEGMKPGKDWMTGQSVYGPLKGGLMVPVSLQYSHKLMNPESAVLVSLGAHIPYEVAIGLNGRVWFRTNSRKMMNVIYNAIRIAQNLATDIEIQVMVQDILKASTSESDE